MAVVWPAKFLKMGHYLFDSETQAWPVNLCPITYATGLTMMKLFSSSASAKAIGVNPASKAMLNTLDRLQPSVEGIEGNAMH